MKVSEVNSNEYQFIYTESPITASLEIDPLGSEQYQLGFFYILDNYPNV